MLKFSMEEEKREEEGRKEIWILHLKGVIKVERICVGGGNSRAEKAKE